MSNFRHSDLEPGMFRVVVFAKPDDPEELVELLMQALGLNRVDARIQTRHVPGLLPESFEQARAVALVTVLAEHGVSAAALPAEDVPSLARPTIVHHAACREDGLEIDGLAGTEVDRVPWQDFELISIGEIPQDAPHHTTTPRMLIVSSGGLSEDTSVPASPYHSPELWLIARHPDRVLRIDSRMMNYEYLGDRKADSSSVNFRHFVDDLVARASQIWLTPFARAWLGHESQFRFQFADSDALRQATLTSLLLHRTIERQSGKPCLGQQDS